MDIKERNTSNANFQRHPWEIIRLEFVLDILKKIYKNRLAPSHVLDVGCGDLYVSEAISDCFPTSEIVAVDAAYDYCFNSSKIRVVNSLDLVPDGTYSLILLLDVLEHIEDDKGFLRDLVQRFSSPDTIFLITVPLHPFLFSEHDIKLEHKRRYTYKELLLKIQEEGLHVIRSGNLFSSLFIFRASQLIFGRFSAKFYGPLNKRSAFTDVAAWNHSVLLMNITKWLLRLDVNYTNRLPGLSGYVLASPSKQVSYHKKL